MNTNHFDIFQLMAVEEAEVSDLEYAFNAFYTTLVMAHVRMVMDFRKTGNEDIVFIPEQNTFYANNVTLWRTLQQDARKRFNIELKAYFRHKRGGGKEIGRLMGRDKPDIVLKMADSMRGDLIGRSFGVLSFGSFVRGIFLNQQHVLKTKYKVNQESSDVNVDMTILNPKTLKNFTLLSAEECVDYMFKYGDTNVDVSGYTNAIGADGNALLKKLTDELMSVEIKKIGTNLKVKTSGKRNSGGLYSKDDAFSALLLLSTLVATTDTSFEICSE